MKKIAYNILLAGLASVLIARAQTNATAPGQPVDNTNTAATALSTTNPVAATVTVVADTNVTTTVTTTVTSNSVFAAVSATNTAVVSSIPLIQFSDVPITTAIENLARQAAINYMLDPKIGYGQPDQTGQLKAEPDRKSVV